jgi:hypothetical protein
MELLMLPKEDLELIDALVWAGCLSRTAAREVASQAQPGKVATCITERGLAPLIAPPQVIIDRLARAEFEYESMAAACKAAGRALQRHGIPLSEVSRVEKNEGHRDLTDPPETD